MPCLPWSPSFFLFSQLLLMKSMCGNEDVCKSTVKSKFKIPRSLPSLVIYKIFNCTHLFGAHVFKINFILWVMKTVVQNRPKHEESQFTGSEAARPRAAAVLFRQALLHRSESLKRPSAAQGNTAPDTKPAVQEATLPAKHSARHCPPGTNMSP